MEVSYKRLTDFISGKTICTIPVYQRNYDWKIEHCKQLLDDIERIISKNVEHFIGTIVFQEKSSGNFKEQIIIDGQQRITSIILLAKAIFDSVEDEQLREEIFTGFIKNSKYDSEFKLKPSEFDADTFKKIMDGENFDNDENSRLYLNYKFFRNELLTKKNMPADFYNALYRLQIVAMKLDKEKPQEIFESLNSTGKDLTETELIRNFLLMDLEFDVQKNLYEKYWLPIEKMLLNSDIFDNFMFQYLVSRRKSSKDMQGSKNIQISKTALYPTFKKYFDKNYNGDKSKSVEDFLADLYGYAEFYSRLIAIENEDFEKLSELEKKFYELIYQVGASSSPIILMDLNNRYEEFIFDEKTFIEMVDALISLMFRSKVCRQTGADTAQNAGNILSRFEKNPPLDIDSFWAAITGGNGKYTFPNDEQFKQALLSGELFLSLKNSCKYLLYNLEKNFGDIKNLPPYNETFIDYVMPKKLNKDWKNYLSDSDNHEIFLNALGNLVLTTDNKKNTEFFTEKRVEFATSKFFFTKALSKNSDWTYGQISSRTKKLTEKAMQIWILPEKYKKSDVVADENNFTLDSDFRNFVSRKPTIISISGKEEHIKHWKDLMYKVLFNLFEADADIFITAASDYLSTDPNVFREPLKIKGDLYFETNRDTPGMLSVIKTIVENFDKIGDTNFKDEIWFTLKN